MADLKLTELSAITSPSLDDLGYVVDDIAGTPTSYKAEWSILLGLANPGLAQGRLTLATGNPVYDPLVSLTPSATDTSAETVDFAAAHGWVTGTRVIPNATVGGLTIGVHYFIRAVDSDTIAFYTTLANALADSSRINLTASITAAIRPVGMAGTTIYYTPYIGNRIALYDGTLWKLHTFTERSLALSSLTSGLPYDVFLYDNAGTLTLELTAWTNDTTRATALTTQDGVYVKTGATTRRYVGTIYTTATDTTEDSSWKRYVYNGIRAVRLPRRLRRYDITVATWTCTAAQSNRQAGANSDNQVSVMQGLAESAMHLTLSVHGRHSNVASYIEVNIGLDGTTSTSHDSNYSQRGYESISVANEDQQYDGFANGILPIGQHDLVWIEQTGNDTATFIGSSGAPGGGLNGWFEC